jgi:hypothetical protein
VNANAITVFVVVASAILNFLLTQPAGTFPQNVLLIIGAVSIGLTTLSRFLPTPNQTQKVEITTPVPTTNVNPGPPVTPPAP